MCPHGCELLSTPLGRSSQNTYSTHSVNKGIRKGRGYYAPALLFAPAYGPRGWSMKWKVMNVLFPRVFAAASPRAPSYFFVPPVMASMALGGGAGSLGKAVTLWVSISPPGRV